MSAWVIGWLAVALALRLAAAVAVDRIVSQTPGRLCLIEGDAAGYWELGGRLARGKSYQLYEPPRRILRMPGFPVLLAGCRLLFGDATFPVRCLLALLGTVGCGLVYLLGRELVDHTVGLWSLAAVSLSPPLVVFTPLLLTESTFAVAMVASVLPVVRMWRESPPKTRWGTALLTGLLIAVATYIRPTWLPFTGVVMLGLLLRDPRQPARWMEGGLVGLAVLAALAPWIARNHAVCGEVVPTTLWVGPSLYDGLNPAATGDSEMSFFDRDNLLATMSEYEMDREYRRRAWAFVAMEPGRALELAVIKAGRYWSPWPNAPQFDQPLLRWGLIAATLPLYGGALLGLWLRRRDLVYVVLTLGPAVGFCLVHMLFVGSIRYRLPADALLWIAAATAYAGWMRPMPLAPSAEGTSP